MSTLVMLWPIHACAHPVHLSNLPYVAMYGDLGCRQDVKELKVRPGTDVHDYEVRLRAAQKFLAKVWHCAATQRAAFLPNLCCLARDGMLSVPLLAQHLATAKESAQGFAFQPLVPNRVFDMCRETKSSSLFSSEAVKCSFKKRAAKCSRYTGIRFSIFSIAAMISCSL